MHPAIVLLAWAVAVGVIQPLGVRGLSLTAVFVLPLSLLLAHRRVIQLMRRARWLLLSISLLFVFATPGQRLPGAAGDLGVTLDGLGLAGEHVLRLTLLLASLALVHERLGTTGMMAGLYGLLAPLARWQALQERIVVRLMLILDQIENAPTATWKQWLHYESVGPDHILLKTRPLGFAEWISFVAVVAMFCWLSK